MASRIAEQYVQMSVEGAEECQDVVTRSVTQMAKQVKALQDAMNQDTFKQTMRDGVKLEKQMEKLERKMEFEKLRAHVGTIRANLIWLGKTIDPVTSKIKQLFAAATGKADSRLIQMRNEFRMLTADVKRYATSLLLIEKVKLTGIAGGASSGTMEGERLAKSFEYLTRVLGQGLAPYVRVLSAGIFRLAEGFRTLDPELKNSITRWALIGAGIASLIVLMPVLAGVFAIITSPITIAIAGIAALVLAFDQLFGFTSSGAVDASNTAAEANHSWIDKTIDWLRSAVVAIAQFWNTLMTQSAAASDWIAENLAYIGESIGLLDEGITDMMSKMEKIKPVGIIDIKQIDKGFEKFKARAKSIVPQVENIASAFSDIFEQAKKEGGFKMKLDVSFELFQGTFDRLQKAFAEGNSQDVYQAQLSEQKAINQGITDLIKAVKGIDANPVGK